MSSGYSNINFYKFKRLFSVILSINVESYIQVINIIIKKYLKKPLEC